MTIVIIYSIYKLDGRVDGAKVMDIGAIFNIKGKISLTPSQALEYFGFKLKKGAKGIIFYKRGGKRFMRSWMPRRKQPGTDAQSKVKKVFKRLTRLGSEHLRDIIRPIWEAQFVGRENPRGGKYYSGFNMFMSLNLKRVIGTGNWRRMLISIGEVEPPVVRWTKAYNRDREQARRLFYQRGTRYVKMRVRRKGDKEIGIGIFDADSLEFVHIAPKRYSNAITLTIPDGMSNPIIYLYFKKGNLYSNSSVHLIKWLND